MAAFEFHPKAKEAINAQSTQLLAALEDVKEDPQEKVGSQLNPEFHSPLTLNDSNICGPFNSEVRDPLSGNLIELSFNRAGRFLALKGRNTGVIHKLLRTILNDRYLQKHVSEKFILAKVRECISSVELTDASILLAEFLENEINQSIKQYEIWVPVTGILIEKVFRFGDVTFRSFTKSQIDAWHEIARAGMRGENLAFCKEWFEHLRSNVQGHAAGVVEIYAEEGRAIELAVASVDRACSLLRIFHFSALDPSTSCFCVPRGKELIESQHAFIVDEGHHIRENIAITEKDSLPWEISAAWLKEFQGRGFSRANEFLLLGRKSDYQQCLASALLVYSKVMTAKLPEEKLIYLFVAIEMMLIGNESEPLQKTLGERLAFITLGGGKERKYVARITSECYGFRSRYIHHGKSKIDLDKLKEFMGYVWLFFTGCIKFFDRFETKAEFINYIEDLRYGIARPRFPNAEEPSSG